MSHICNKLSNVHQLDMILINYFRSGRGVVKLHFKEWKIYAHPLQQLGYFPLTSKYIV
jgi:hypothetical protein